jgi:hypothetical protein
MSAPPLPDTFGNYALGDFVEVVSPTAISWWPQTTGWWFVAAGLGGLALYKGWKHLRHWYRNRYRREATARLQSLAEKGDNTDIVSEINRVLKLTALVAYSREQVARLSGDEWVGFLNRHCSASPFSADLGRLLALAPYKAETVNGSTGQQLLDASLTWVKKHENPADD